MQKILRIARLELAVLFYSPIAWLLLIIFVVQCGITYTDMLYRMETFQQLGRNLPVLTRALFSGEDGVLTTVAQTLYFYIPLLTMGLMSREISSGSIKLLQSSPVTNIQVVLGKFAGMTGYGLLLCSVIMVYLLAAYGSVEFLDTGFIIGGTFGLFMLLCAYSAIGLFMSSLTGYPIVAAISTLSALAALNYIGHLGQGIDGFREVTYWLALSGKVENIINGLLTTREISYFLSVTVFFLTLTVMKLNSGRKRRPLALRLVSYSGLVALLVAVVFISSRPSLIHYWDTTRTDDQTLSQKSQDLIARLDGRVKLTAYTNVLDKAATFGEPKSRIKDRREFEVYQRFLPDMDLSYVSYYDSISYGLDSAKTLEEQARHLAKVRGFDFSEVLSPEEISDRIDVDKEGRRFVRMLEYGDKSTPLRMFNDIVGYPREPEVIAALKRLIDGPAAVWALAANGERAVDRMDDASYGILTQGLEIRTSLINQGFDTKAVALDTISEIPLSIAVLIIADPMKAYDDQGLEKIRRYIERGGNLLLAGEPGKQAFTNPIASQLGIHFQEGTVMQESAYNEADFVQALLSPEADSVSFGLFAGAKVTMPGVTSLHIADTSDFRVTPLLVSDPISTWNKLGMYDLALEKIRFDPATERKEQLILLAGLSRQVNGREQRIIVSGDADFMSNTEVVRSFVQNASFVVSRMFRWFSYGEYPYSPNGEKAVDRKLKIGRSGVNWQKVLFFGVLPLLIGVSGTVTLIRRKRH